MKMFATVLLTSMIAACGVSHNQTQSELNTSATNPKKMVFVDDRRPVDGALTEITIINSEDDSYKATLHTAFVDRRNGQEVHNAAIIGSNLACSFTKTVVTCERDMRPVDGALTVLTLTKDENGYTATLRRAMFDHINGREIDETNEIGSHLSLQ